MDDFNNISELVNKSGVTFEEAKYAYEASGKDMLEAMIMIERSQKAKAEAANQHSGASTNPNPNNMNANQNYQYGYNPNPNNTNAGQNYQYGYNYNQNANRNNQYSYGHAGKEFFKEECKRKWKEQGRKAGHTCKGFFHKLSQTNMRVTAENGKEYFNIPTLAAIIIALFCWQVMLPVIIVALFCKVKFIFSGPDIAEDIVFAFNTGSKSSKPEDAPAPIYNYTQTENYSKTENTDNGFFSK